MLGLDGEVLVLQALGNLEEDKEALATDLTHRVLQEVDHVLGKTQVETSLDLVRVAGLED